MGFTVRDSGLSVWGLGVAPLHGVFIAANSCRQVTLVVSIVVPFGGYRIGSII